jgi:uncharacterized protein (TIGR02217 family)
MFIESPRFPEKISLGAMGGPEYSTDVIVLNSGFESRNQNWAQPLAKFDVSHGIKTQDELNALIAFFRTVKGRANGFRFKDWSDFKVLDGFGYLVATGVADQWQLVKKYSSGIYDDYRIISKPIASTIVFGGGGTYTLDDTTGIVDKTAGADPTGWLGEFDVPVRFDTDSMRTTIENYRVFSWGQIPIVEIRV